jgi:carboxypeptidase family protein/TonB-dependent receptor-like protein
MRRVLLPLVATLVSASVVLGQTESATISGRVTDSTGSVIRGASVQLLNANTGTLLQTPTNDAGIYLFPSVRPGIYNLSVKKEGFKTEDYVGLTANVQDHLEHNFRMTIGAASESVTVTAEAAKINTQDATVSTVVDRNFAENLPMNGRSFQTLIQLTPGVVVIPSNVADEGQFTVNGQRATSNYWMVDGVSANIGINAGNHPTNGFGGTVGGFSAQGGTNSLVSVDALQEFRIQTSTYAPEFGRTPGGQISIVTRSGTNQFHGTASDYFRHDALDASDWFVNYNHLSKPKERQNDFATTFDGPLIKDRTFFFFSYEGLRLRLPQVAQSAVPDLSARQSAIPALQPFLNAFPLPNGADNTATGVAQFNASFANSSTLDAYSLRVDHDVADRVAIFGRYNYSPSESLERGVAAQSLNTVTSSRISTQTSTLGATWGISSTVVNDLRFNYSRVNAAGFRFLDNFGGAVPLSSLPLPSPFTDQDSIFNFHILGLSHGQLLPGRSQTNLQRQINIVDALSFTRGSHDLKLGVDFRQMTPFAAPPLYVQVANFLDVTNAKNGNLRSGAVVALSTAGVRFHNIGTYVQDTWHVIPRLNLTYGIRWDLETAPKSINGPDIVAVTGYDLIDLSHLAIAPAGTAPFKTNYTNFAPRLGLAYQLSENPDRATVLRGGFGVFYDLIASTVGAAAGGNEGPPFGAVNGFAGSFPLDAARSTPPAIPNTGSLSLVYAFNPNIKSPYTLEGNIAIEQALGRQQTISVSYLWASGRRLLQDSVDFFPTSNPSVIRADFIDNTASSTYNALQIQFQRRMSHGLQLLGSYTLAHSTDNGSAGSAQLNSNHGLPGSSADANRGPSDFDVRHTFSVGLTYDIPFPKMSPLANAFLQGWSIDSSLLARSAPPVDVSDFNFFTFNGGIYADVRPDLVPGQPLYLYGANCATVMQALGYLAPGQGCPGGKALNPKAFQDPPADPKTGQPLRQGTVRRNSLRGFGALQWDLALHRVFTLHNSLQMQLRVEVFNVLNHPNFGQPNGGFFTGSTSFGLASQTLAPYLNGGGGASNLGGGAFNPLYQIGGPRSIQLGLKLFF